MSLKPVPAFAAFLLMTAAAHGGDYSRGIGIYPGRQSENTSPEIVKDNTYRNVALGRQAFHSSAFDYNLTAQLVTDGIVGESDPAWLEISTIEGLLPLREREWTVDGGPYSSNVIIGEDNFLHYEWHNMEVRADSLKMQFSVAYYEALADGGYSIGLMVPEEGTGKVFTRSIQGNGLPGKASRRKVSSDPNKQTGTDLLPTRTINLALPLPDTGFKNLTIALKMKGAAYWTIPEVNLSRQGNPVRELLPSNEFHSAWMSATGGEQWVYVDLGTSLSFDKVLLHWIKKPLEGEIQVSEDASHWRTVARLPRGKELKDEVKCKGTGRYVRVLMTRPGAGGRYVLSEMEVMGRGGLVAKPQEVRGWQDGRYMLDGGPWKVQRASQVQGGGNSVSSKDFDDSAWIVATVPGTVLTSYVNAGAVPDPDYADNVFHISESFFNSDFWYRTTFQWLPGTSHKRIFLNFDGINWKADIFLNGKKAGRLDGAFKRGRFDVTGLVHKGENILAVRILKNAHPAAVKEKTELNTDINGGLLGLDNPTFHATVGWDWINTIRGRDIGIWNNVYLSAEEQVCLKDPVVSTVLSGTLATMTPAVRLENNSGKEVRGILKGWIGEIQFEKEVILPAAEVTQVDFHPGEFPQLEKQQMELWWPNGYGEPHLYEAGFEFLTSGKSVSTLSYRAGIRQVTWSGEDTALQLYVNGTRVVPLGGNWGFSESNLNYRSREYDIAVRYHKEMNFNMIRNWVGQTGDEEFYEACDRHGIMVWQDFWLANPYDGPDPADGKMFLDNAYDYVNRIRNHSSIVLYCGRNEGFPPEYLDSALRECVRDLHPGLPYISSSADKGVSGHGPYCVHPSEYYFEKQTGKLHSERGMPNFVNIESLRRMISPDKIWPMGDAWGKHDFTRQGAQKADTFNEILFKAFGEPSTVEEYASLAQWVNYDGYRAMYESNNIHRQGLLIWMSHSCWPSLTWQTYDYYFDPTAAFFACKKACERVHIQYNAATGNIEVANTGRDDLPSLEASYEFRNMYGKVLDFRKEPVNCPSDSTVICGRATVPEGYEGVYFLRLRLCDKDGRDVSENTYVLSTDKGNLKALRELPSVMPDVETFVEGTSARITLMNTSEVPVLMIRLNLKGSDGEQILPASYSDNYFHLMPYEIKTVEITWDAEDARGSVADIGITGFNIP